VAIIRDIDYSRFVSARIVALILLLSLIISPVQSTTTVSFPTGVHIIDLGPFPYIQSTDPEPYGQIMITKTVLNETATQGDNVTFIINITNTGDIALQKVRVVDVLPIGQEYTWDDSTPKGVASGNVVTWENVGPLAIGASKFIKLWAEVVLRGT
jgi:uncharacterized repeat protein (TIGR01451 family)